jgi:hypothetical protein
MRLDSLVVAFPAWAGVLPASRRQANTREGVPVARRQFAEGSVGARRLALGLTQQWVADRLGIARCTVQRLEARPAHVRGVRSDVTALRARVNALYRSLERGRVES